MDRDELQERRNKQTHKGPLWYAAVIVGLDLIPQEGELVARMAFLTRNDGQASGEIAVLTMEQLASIIDKLGVSATSKLVGKACQIKVLEDGKSVAYVDHLFACNPVRE